MKFLSWADGTCGPMLYTIIFIENIISAVGVSPTKLNGNGYDDVLVAIHSTVDESLSDPLIQAITDMVSEASKSLYQATHGTLFFRKVNILIPSTWKNVNAESAAQGESFEDNDIKIDKLHPMYKHQPYTLQHEGCGKPGRYIHLTPEYLLHHNVSTLWGSKGKVLLHEWAKLRWGIFDEMGYDGDLKYPVLYMNSSERYAPTLCANKHIEGRYLHSEGRSNTFCSVTGQSCYFQPKMTQSATSSIMSYYAINSSSVVEFCDSEQSDHPHDADAPTKQNAMCQSKSAWEIMMRHQDFANYSTGERNQGSTSTTEPMPTNFQVIKRTTAHYALVLDYSGSMDYLNRVDKMVKETRRWLLTAVAVGSQVAIIRFSTAATVLKPLTEITDNASRHALANSLELRGNGSTCIGCGLLKAIEVLRRKRPKIIFLLTDGEENVEHNKITDVTLTVQRAAARVITLAFGPSATGKLENLSRVTSGKAFTMNDADPGGMMEDAFESTLTYQPYFSHFEAVVVIYNGPVNQSEGTFQIDKSIGRNTTFRASVNVGVSSTPNLRLRGPDGSVYASVSTDSNISSWFIIVDMAKEGEWHWELGLPDQEAKDFSVKITSLSREEGKAAIRTTPWISNDDVNATIDYVKVYAEVKQGNNPVVNADVRAIVTPPDDSADQEYQLFDNGEGADMMAGDGIYSRFITKFAGDGRYNVKAQVSDGGTALINTGDFLTTLRRKRSTDNDDYFDTDAPTYCCGSVMPLNPDTARATGSFTRVAAIGSVKVVGISPGDIFPPFEVRDFHVSLTDPSQTTHQPYNVSFTWTATGDDLDDGIVSEYIIRMSTNRSYLRESNFDYAPEETDLGINATEMNLLLEAGERIFFTTTIEMNLTDRTHYFALKAIDDFGQKSRVSNVAVLKSIPLIVYEEEVALPIWLVVLLVVVLLLAIISVVLIIIRRNTKTYEVVEMQENPAV